MSIARHWRIYADADGESHLERVELPLRPTEYAPPAPAFDVSEPIEAARYVHVRFPPGWFDAAHPAPRPQIGILTSGSAEFSVSDGSSVIVKTGDAMLVEDTHGKGHGLRVLGDDDLTMVIIQRD